MLSGLYLILGRKRSRSLTIFAVPNSVPVDTYFVSVRNTDTAMVSNPLEALCKSVQLFAGFYAGLDTARRLRQRLTLPRFQCRELHPISIRIGDHHDARHAAKIHRLHRDLGPALLQFSGDRIDILHDESEVAEPQRIRD